MTQINHENNFSTNLTNAANAGDTTSYLAAVPTVSAPFYLIFDSTNKNDSYEEVYVTSKTATTVVHGALTHPHSTDETIVMSFGVTEFEELETRATAGSAIASSSIGEIAAYPLTAAPTNWLRCDGSAVSRSTYATLFSILGTAYGVGDGSTTFNVPNIQDKIIVGVKSTDTSFDTLGETGGADSINFSHYHTQDHTHTLTGSTGAGNATGAGDQGSTDTVARGTHTHAFSLTTSTQSATNTTTSLTATATENPYIVLNYIIRYQ